MPSSAKLNPRLKAQLARTPEIAVRAAAQAMEDGAQEIVNLMRSRASEKSGELRDSIKWTWGDAPNGSLVIDEIRSGQNRGSQYATLRISIYVSNEAFYARWVEFGTRAGVRAARASTTKADLKKSSKRAVAGRVIKRTHPGSAAHPFFYPSWREERAKFKRNIRAAVRRAIKEAINV